MARDATGGVLFTASRRVRAWWSLEIVEGKALLFAIKLALRHGYEQVIVESDRQVLVSRLAKTTVIFSEFDDVLEDILFFSSSLISVRWSHVKRDGNHVAHYLAKIVSFGVEQV